MSLLLILLCFSPLPSSCDEPSVYHPVIVVPGLAGSRLEARLNKPSVVNRFCYQKYDWFTLWLDPLQLVTPSAIDCFVDNIRRVFNPATGLTENAPGVETRVPGFGETDSIEYLTSTKLLGVGRCVFAAIINTSLLAYIIINLCLLSSNITLGVPYFAKFISNLVKKLGYRRGHSIRGAPYDFRLAPCEFYLYFTLNCVIVCYFCLTNDMRNFL